MITFRKWHGEQETCFVNNEFEMALLEHYVTMLRGNYCPAVRVAYADITDVDVATAYLRDGWDEAVAYAFAMLADARCIPVIIPWLCEDKRVTEYGVTANRFCALLTAMEDEM